MHALANVKQARVSWEVRARPRHWTNKRNSPPALKGLKRRDDPGRVRAILAVSRARQIGYAPPVASHAEAWIETVNKVILVGNLGSRLPRGGVD